MSDNLELHIKEANRLYRSSLERALFELGYVIRHFPEKSVQLMAKCVVYVRLAHLL